LAVGSDTSSQEVAVYDFDATNSTLSLTASYNVGYSVNSVSWCLGVDGCEYLASGGKGSGASENIEAIRVYNFDGSSLSQITTQDPPGEVNSVSWCGINCERGWCTQLIAVGVGSGTDENIGALNIYQFDGESLLLTVSEK